jgi:hypothetical protein
MQMPPNKSLKAVRIRSLDSLNRRMLRICAACVCPLALDSQLSANPAHASQLKNMRRLCLPLSSALSLGWQHKANREKAVKKPNKSLKLARFTRWTASVAAFASQIVCAALRCRLALR